jgi:hypothetical protein
MAERQGGVTASGRRGGLDRIRLVLAATAYLAACALQAVGRWPEDAARWFAPAFFAVAGFAAVPAFRGRRFGEWAVAKVLRLFVPAVFGALLVAVPLLYLKRPGEVDEWAGHLVFLPVLFAFTLAMKPLLALLAQRPTGPRLPVVLLPLTAALPAAIAAIPGSAAWVTWVASAGACAAAWTLGAVAASGPAAEAVLARLGRPTLAAGLALACAAVVLRLSDAAPTARFVVDAAASGAFASASLALGLCGSASARPVPARLNEWVLPFFLFSRPVFLAVGRAMAGLPIGAIPRAAIATALAAAITLAACEIARRSDLLRFLTGLRERSNAP